MSPESYAQVSNLLIPTATVIYALAMVSHAMEWAVGRASVAKAPADAAKAAPAEAEDRTQAELLVASGSGSAVPAASATGSSSTVSADSRSGGGSAPASTGAEGTGSSERMDAASRIGLLLTWLAFVFHLSGVVTRGLAAGRVPWGNMYEFSITASLAVAIVYLAFVQRYKLQWLGLGVTLVVAAVLGLATLALYTPAGPLVPALHSYWLVIHVLSLIHI